MHTVHRRLAQRGGTFVGAIFRAVPEAWCKFGTQVSKAAVVDSAFLTCETPPQRFDALDVGAFPYDVFVRVSNS